LGKSSIADGFHIHRVIFDHCGHEMRKSFAKHLQQIRADKDSKPTAGSIAVQNQLSSEADASQFSGPCRRKRNTSPSTRVDIPGATSFTKSLHFSDGELMFECNTSFTCECGSQFSRDQSRLLSLRAELPKVKHHIAQMVSSSEHLADRWREAVTEYSV
jgi:hypothetical protein